MPIGAPPPPPPVTDETAAPTIIPPRSHADSAVGVVNVSIAAGATVPIPGIREDLGLVELIIGTDVAALLTVDVVPIRTPASESIHIPLGEPVLTGQPHGVTNNTAGDVFVSLYAVGRQRRTSDYGFDPLSPSESRQVSPAATD